MRDQPTASVASALLESFIDPKNYGGGTRTTTLDPRPPVDDRSRTVDQARPILLGVLGLSSVRITRAARWRTGADLLHQLLSRPAPNSVSAGGNLTLVL